jgi:hypothetical protein
MPLHHVNITRAICKCYCLIGLKKRQFNHIGWTCLGEENKTNKIHLKSFQISVVAESEFPH